MKISGDKTQFRNSKERVIYKGERGGFYVKKANGTKSYNPVAAFRQMNNGSLTKVTVQTVNVPSPIRRAVRKNAGVTRGPREGTLLRRMNAESKKLAAKGPRRVRSNKGVARGPREGTLLRRMNTESKKLAAKGPVVNVIITSPGGTSLTKRQIAARKAAKTRLAKKMKGNPYGALAM